MPWRWQDLPRPERTRESSFEAVVVPPSVNSGQQQRQRARPSVGSVRVSHPSITSRNRASFALEPDMIGEAYRLAS